MTDVAKLAGVSAITVSRAISTPDSVSPETLQKVRDAIDRTGYVPNMLAGGLASTRSYLVDALIPSISAPVFQETIEALTLTLAEAGYQLMLGQTGYTDSREDALLETIIGRRPDGIVITGILRSASARRRVLAANIPVVETWDLTRSPVDMVVGFSHEKIGGAVADYLHTRGRRRLAVITAADERARLRSKGFSDAAVRLAYPSLANAEIPVFVAPAPGVFGGGRRGFREILAQYPTVDAVFCSSDTLALGAVTEAQHQGLRIPEDIAIVGYGDVNFAADMQPSLTTVSVNGRAIGETTARLIISRASGQPVEQKIIDVGFSIIQRESA